MRESRKYGSVRGARGNPRPYRDPRSTEQKSTAVWLACPKPRLPAQPFPYGVVAANPKQRGGAFPCSSAWPPPPDAARPIAITMAATKTRNAIQPSLPELAPTIA